MNHFEADEHYVKQGEFNQSHVLRGFLTQNQETPIERVESMATQYLPASPLKAASKRAEIARPETQPPHVLEIEMNCDECGGSGFDPGGIDPWGPEPCPACHGAKMQRITRNYLTEAFQIAANPESTRPVERQHLVAVIQHCRQAVSALVSLPEVP
jgi:hypothetical protein